MSRSFKFVPPSATDRLLGRPPAAASATQLLGTSIKNASQVYKKEEDKERIARLQQLQIDLLGEIENLKQVLPPAVVPFLQSFANPDFPIEHDNETKSNYNLIRVGLKGYDEINTILEIIDEMEEIQKKYPAQTRRPQLDQDSSDSGPSSVVRPRQPTMQQEPGTVPRPPVVRKLLPPKSPVKLRPSPASQEEVTVPQPSGRSSSTATQPTYINPADSSEAEPASRPGVEYFSTTPTQQQQGGGGWAWIPYGWSSNPTPAILPTPPTQATATVAATPPLPVKQLAKAINNVLQRALVPLLDSIGALAFALGEQDVRSFMVYDERQKGSRRDLPTDRLRVIDEDDPKLITVDYLMERYEPILGNSFLKIYLEQALVSLTNQGNQLVKEQSNQQQQQQQKLVNACFDFDRDLLFEPPFGNSAETLAALKKIVNPSEKVKAKIADLETAQEAARMVRRTEPESRFAPAWAFSVLGNSVFRAIASPPVLAAFEMAANQVRSFPGCSSFTLKELLCSSATMNQFVFLAARHYMRDISVLAAGATGGRRKRQGGNYINVNQARKELQERAFVISIWFERVYAVPNPLLDEFDAYKRGFGEGPLDPAFEARMQQYKAALPQRELRHKD